MTRSQSRPTNTGGHSVRHPQQQRWQKQPMSPLEDQDEKIVVLSSSSSGASVSNAEDNATGGEIASPQQSTSEEAHCAEGVRKWRDQLSVRSDLGQLNTAHRSQRRSVTRKSSKNTFSTIGRRGSFLLSQAVTPRKKPLESQEEQLETYRSLQDRQFVSTHEELQYLRVMYMNSQKVLSRKNEEIEKLNKEILEKANEIDRLNGLLEGKSRRRRNSVGSVADEDRIVSARGSSSTVTPSLSLYARSTVDEKLSDKMNGGGGPPAKMLLELRQNVASRDTMIDNLRMELHAAQHGRKEEQDRANKLRSELEDAKAKVDKLCSQLTTKDSVIEDMQRRLLSLPAAATESRTLNFYKVSRGSDGSNSPQKWPICEENGDCSIGSCSPPDRGHKEPQHFDGSSTMVFQSTSGSEKQQQELQSAFRLELEHLRRCLEREKDTNTELERHWRRRQEAERRMAEVELNTVRSEAEAFRRELTRLQQHHAVSNFAENQLQTARSENDILQQRIQELREENAAQASREIELRNNLRLLREACERHEEEVETLQRRMKVMKDNESRLQEDVNILEEKLSHAERMRVAETNSGSSFSCDIGSYVSLMSLNEKLQRRTEELEEEIRSMRELHTDGFHNGVKGECDPSSECSRSKAAANVINGTLPVRADTEQGVIELVTSPTVMDEAVAVARAHTESEEQFNCAGQGPNTLKRPVNFEPSDTMDAVALSTSVQNLQEELQGVRDRLRLAESELATLREQQTLNEQRVREAVRRKVTSLRAAREEADRCCKMLKQQEIVVEQLQRQCEEQRRLIEIHGLPAKGVTTQPANVLAGPSFTRAACAQSKGSNSPRERVNEEKYIEEALRCESMKLDEEMESLRQRLDRAIEERDQWRRLATEKDQGGLPEPL